MSMHLKKSTQIKFKGWKQIFSLLFFAISFAVSSYGQCSMSCDDEIQVSLNQDCEAEITYAMILRDPDNSNICSPNGPRAYKVVVMDEEGVTIPTSPIITCEYIGRTLLIKVKHWYSGNSCWSKVKVEDKFAPVMSNCEPVELWCNQNSAPTNEGGEAPVPSMADACSESCQTMTMNYVDSDSVTYVCGDEELAQGIIAKFNRTWTACDNLGNCQTCVQLVIIRIPAFSEIEFPPHLTGELAITCGDCDPTDLDCTGRPSLYHKNLDDAFCDLKADYIDITSNTQCEGSYTIERAWTIRNTCTEETHNYTQLIEIVDQTPPIIICLEETAMVILPSTTPNSCTSNVMVPSAEVTDNCASSENITVITKLYKLDSTGKRMLLEKVESNGGFAMDLEFGKYEVYYQATDPCSNVSNNVGSPCTFEIKDDIPPTPVCHIQTKLSLDSEGKGIIYAESFDNGSYDNCCIEKYEVRILGDENEEFMEYVELNCEEANSADQLSVQLQITDCYGNTSNCIIEVLIDDSTPPVIISCAEDVLVSCSEDFSLDYIRDNLLTPPVAEDACVGGVNSQAIVKQDYRNECGIGAVIFDWEVFDGAGNGPVTCEQLVSFIDDTPIAVSFPDDYSGDGCLTEIGGLIPEITGVPTITGVDCETIEVLSSDSGIAGDASCQSFNRTWVITNLCDENGTIEHVQTISISDTEAPIIDCNGEFFDICLDGGVCARSFEIAGVTVTDCSDEISVRATWTFTPHAVCTDSVQTGEVSNAELGFMSQEFGPGQLWVNFYATDACGNESVCNRDYTIKDCEAPEVLCLPGVTLTLDGEGQVEVWANDFHQEIIDNCEDCGEVEYIYSFTPDTSETVRFYDCDDLGVKTAQIWVTDAFGNQNYCAVTFVIKGAEMCNGLGIDTTAVPDVDGMAGIAGKIFQEDGDAVEAVTVNAENHLAEMMDRYMTDVNGAYAFEFQKSANLVINPNKNDDVRNGVTTYDILQLRKHILGMEELDSPYKIIAADINHSNSVTTKDIIDLRRVILEYDNEFTNNTSWRFIKADHQFEDPTNPFVGEMPEYATIPELTEEMEIDFIGIKIGDLNGNAVGQSSFNAPTKSRNNRLVNFEIVEKEIAKNTIETVTFTLIASEIQALQMTLNFDPRLVEIIDIPTTAQVNEANFGNRFLNKGALTMSWDAPTHTNELFTFQLRVKTNSNVAASELFTINSTFTPAEAYDEHGNVYQIGLVISGSKYDYELFQNQPNPFKQATTIRFALPAKSQGKLTVLDITGQTLKSIEQTFEKGINELIINDLQQKGLLYYHLETDFGVLTQKMLRVE